MTPSQGQLGIGYFKLEAWWDGRQTSEEKCQPVATDIPEEMRLMFLECKRNPGNWNQLFLESVATTGMNCSP